MIKNYITIFLFLTAIHVTAQTNRRISPITKSNHLKFPLNPHLSQASGCDTINYPVPDAWTLTYYVAGTGGSDGFVTGNNRYGDQEKAAYFDVSSSANTFLTKVWIAFAKANSNLAANFSKTISFKIYDGTTAEPGALLATVIKSLSQLRADAQNGFYSEVIFPTAVELPQSKKFFVSVDVSSLSWSAAGGYDSLAVFSNQSNQTVAGSNGFGWEKNNNAWNTFATGWGTNLSLIVHPFLSTNSACALTLPANVTFSGRAFLQGPFNAGTGIMSNALNTLGILQANAATQPYNGSGFNYTGTENIPAGFFATHPDFVDWVLVELRNAGNPAIVVATRAAFLKQDGTLVETDGLNNNITFQGVPFTNYYVAVRHRNHLGVMSSGAIDFSSGSGTHDFTSSMTNAYAGSVSNMPMATLAPGVYGLWGGNANEDLQVKMTGLTAANNDYLRLLNTLGSSINSLPNVYSKQDVNLDGRINMTGLSPANNDYLKLINILGSSINSVTQPAF